MRQRVRIDKSIPNEGALDFSHLLDAPAGKHGFVRVQGGHLYFEDGLRAKFYGFNFPARASMPDHETAERLAARLATLGANVVRLHAADVMPGPKGWTANPESPLLDYASGSSRNFHPEGLDRLDYFFCQLKKRGIYIHLDLYVARVFLEGDDLDYPEPIPAHCKGISHYNQRLIELQKEYAKELLTHVNPYTGLSYADEPAVMAVEIANEDSAFFDNNRIREYPGWKYYFAEMQERFNHFLLAKYHTRENLKQAWTWEGLSALGDEEDPAAGSVGLPHPGEYIQPLNDPMGEWTGMDSPARYADYTEFCIALNEKYHKEMMDFLRGIGCRVPIAPENLLRGMADIYSDTCGDIIENNAYFNHPKVGYSPDYTLIPNMAENVSNDPRTHSYPDMNHRTNIISQVSPSFVAGKPFLMTEWNEYGAYPFHSTAFPMTTAYACLQDWDGLILYTYHTSDRDDDQPGDIIEDIMDSFNDPSMICQFGAMAAVFLKGLVRRADKKVESVFTRNQLKTQPTPHRLIHSILPYVSKLETVFLTEGDIYEGQGDVAVSGGFLSDGDLRNADHGVIFAQSPYRDAYRKSFAGEKWLDQYKDETSQEIEKGIWLNDRFLVFDEIASLSVSNDYRKFAATLSDALKKWGILDSGCGITKEDEIVSDTGEIRFDPQKGRFRVEAPCVRIFSGHVKGDIDLGEGIAVACRNRKITMVMLPLDGKECDRSLHYLLFAIGESGMDETRYEKCENGKDYRMFLAGRLALDVLEGDLYISGTEKMPEIRILDMYGKALSRVPGERTEAGKWKFGMTGTMPSACLEVILTD